MCRYTQVCTGSRVHTGTHRYVQVRYAQVHTGMHGYTPVFTDTYRSGMHRYTQVCAQGCTGMQYAQLCMGTHMDVHTFIGTVFDLISEHTLIN